MPSRLAPGDIARQLFTIDKDRDERASQLCAEMLLTLITNGFAAPAAIGDLRSPKVGRFTVRSLALGTNFLEGDDTAAGSTGLTREELGSRLADGQDVLASDKLHLAKATLEGLIDPDTRRGQSGTHLLFPFHESLLWYDARARRRTWAPQQVLMRGSGITLARLLLDPPDREARAYAVDALAEIQEALTAPGPLADVAATLDSALGTPRPVAASREEKEAWETGARETLAPLARHLARHARAVMKQHGNSAPARLWQMRHIIALDLCLHLLRTAWVKASSPSQVRYLLLAFGDLARSSDLVRQRSEQSYRQARITISEAIVATLAEELAAVAAAAMAWDEAFDSRSPIVKKATNRDVYDAIRRATTDEEFASSAREAYERASYDRAAGDGFRVLIDSIGMVAGTGAYQYLTASPQLLATLVGAMADRMPMTFANFSQAVFDEWRIVIGDEAYVETDLASRLDSDELARNGRRAEQLMIDAGLAVGLSDRTTIVGEKVAFR